jgi:hypothetical protein
MRHLGEYLGQDRRGNRKILHNYELCGVFSSPYYLGDKINKNEMAGIVVRMRKRRGVNRVLVRNHEGKFVRLGLT